MIKPVLLKINNDINIQLWLTFQIAGYDNCLDSSIISKEKNQIKSAIFTIKFNC